MRVNTSRKGLGLLFKLRYAHDCMYIYIYRGRYID